MSAFKSLVFPLVTAFLYFSCIPFSYSLEVEELALLPATSGKSADENSRIVFSWSRIERFLAESDEPPLNSTLILASKRTSRRDPLNDFKKYRGGWNISEKHYWASVAFTAAPFFIIAAACVGCIVLYIGQGKFHSSTVNTLGYVVNQANTTSERLRNVSGYLSAARNIGVDQTFLPSNVQSDIDRIQGRINSSASTLATRTEDNSHDIRRVINSVRLALIVLSAVMLGLTFLGFV